MNGLHERCDLPNRDGYKFTGVTHTGERVPCHVVKGPDGIHRVAGAKLTDLAGWEYLPAAKKGKGG